mmetsp:Transcript_11560/g.34553  ORF Transcript_11560/g.34553 Transcript_11560/m.34553 type:complete len:308 (-) Transcript_11560:220-1143(-)
MRRASSAGATSGSLSRVCRTELKSNGELACELLPEPGRPEKSRDRSTISSSGRRDVQRPAACGSPPRSSSSICSLGIASSAPSSGKHHAPAPCACTPLLFRPRFAGGGPSREAPPSLRFALFAAAALGWFSSSLPRSRLRRAASSCFASAAARFSAAALSLSAAAAAFSAAAFSAACFSASRLAFAASIEALRSATSLAAFSAASLAAFASASAFAFAALRTSSFAFHSGVSAGPGVRLLFQSVATHSGCSSANSTISSANRPWLVEKRIVALSTTYACASIPFEPSSAFHRFAISSVPVLSSQQPG